MVLPSFLIKLQLTIICTESVKGKLKYCLIRQYYSITILFRLCSNNSLLELRNQNDMISLAISKELLSWEFLCKYLDAIVIFFISLKMALAEKLLK